MTDASIAQYADRGIRQRFDVLKSRYAERDGRMNKVASVRGGNYDEAFPGLFPSEWPKPIVANFIDSYVFFSIAFSGGADEYMAVHWPEIALSQSILKIVVGFIIFLPAYGLLLNFMKKRLGNTDQG